MDLKHDALTAALDDLKLRCVPLQETASRGEWRRSFPLDDISLHLVISGDCLINAAVRIWRHRLTRGEMLVVNRGVEGELRSTSGDHRPPEVLSMRVQLDAQHGHPLVDSFPPLIRASPTGVPRSFGPAMDTLFEELSIPVVGRGVILRRLCEVLFIQALRMHLGDLSWNDQGWFRALADPVLREHMHFAADPSASVSVLASAAHRSTRRIRARFLQFSGSRPAVFIREARVWRAAALLRQGESDLEKIAALIGYGSRQALARAFRRRLGVSPTEYWRQVLSRPFPRARREPTCKPAGGPIPSSRGWGDPAQPK